MRRFSNHATHLLTLVPALLTTATFAMVKRIRMTCHSAADLCLIAQDTCVKDKDGKTKGHQANVSVARLDEKAGMITQQP